ncbi:hypothetical protein Zmor_027893 [Zophobas morio]|uniref:Uncharacterized protein n=1 Tax=Zophobas morio TaxID=2755281 RepID=A0AA38HPL7_9CUCU|nr:hypothetical protein Zmor_027893 [Zophobas morio]
MQLVLSASDGVPLDKMADIADKLQEVHVSNAMTTSWNIAAITTKTHSRTQDNDDTRSSIAALKTQIAALRAAMEKMSTDRGRRFQRQQYRPRSRSNSRNRLQNPNWCYYHNNFGNRARKCRAPCDFQPAGN